MLTHGVCKRLSFGDSADKLCGSQSRHFNKTEGHMHIRRTSVNAQMAIKRSLYATRQMDSITMKRSKPVGAGPDNIADFIAVTMIIIIIAMYAARVLRRLTYV